MFKDENLFQKDSSFVKYFSNSFDCDSEENKTEIWNYKCIIHSKVVKKLKKEHKQYFKMIKRLKSLMKI